jgi:hypothetical protein
MLIFFLLGLELCGIGYHNIILFIRKNLEYPLALESKEIPANYSTKSIKNNFKNLK